MEDKKNNKPSGATKIAIFFGILGIVSLLLGSNSSFSILIGIICLVICGFLVLASKGAKKNAETANELTEVINSDPNYASDKELLALLEDALQKIKNECPDKPSTIIGSSKRYQKFASQAIQNGALVVLGTSLHTVPYSWRVFTDHINAGIAGGWTGIDESPSILPAGTYCRFNCHKTAVYNTTTYTTKTDASVTGRAVAGAVIAGPVGAVVGAVNAADKNNRGGVTRTKTNTKKTGYDYNIRFNTEDVDWIYINTKALREKSSELQGFLNHNTKLIGDSDTIVLKLEKNILSSDKMEKLAQLLTDIVNNLSQDKAED